MKKKDLLNKWLNDEITPAEFEVLRTMPEFSSYHKIDGFVKGMDIPSFDSNTSLLDVKSKIGVTQKSSRKVIRLSNILKIAAVLALLTASYIYLDTRSTTHNTISSIEQIALPDLSTVSINKNSQIQYKKNKWDLNREVFLLGEAYFEVETGNTFEVVTAQGTISVLGTKFNVNATDNSFEVSCYEGLVGVLYNGKTIKLSKGESVKLVNDRLSEEMIFTNRPNWLYDESSFDDVLVKNVLEEFEKQYSVSIDSKNIDVNLRFTGSFTHENIESAIQSITIPLDLKYELSDKNAIRIFAQETVQE